MSDVSIPPLVLANLYELYCANCGKQVNSLFVSPDGKTWWCRECLPQHKQVWISETERNK